MTVQKIYLRTNQAQSSGNPNGKSVIEIDQQLRDFVLQDTARLRSEAEPASGPVSHLERENATEVIIEVNSLVQQVAGVAVDQVDEAIADLRQLRDFLHSEGERVRRETRANVRNSQSATRAFSATTKRIRMIIGGAMAERYGLVSPRSLASCRCLLSAH